MTCSAVADCAPDQVCGSDGLCAAEDVAGKCASVNAPTDAGADGARPDARPDAAPDAWTTVMLVVHIDGRGSVAIPAVGTCDGGSGQTTCPFAVKIGLPITLHATPKNNWALDGWSEACAGSTTATCALTPTANTSARVQFRMDD